MAGQALGESFTVVAISRVLAAIGAAAFQANAYVMAGAIAPETRRGQALATVAAGMSVSMVLGVPIGVLAGNLVGWCTVMWGIDALGILVALAIPVLPAVHVPAAGLRDRLSVVVRPPIARVLTVTVLAMLATFSVGTYLSVIAKDVAAGAVLAWVLIGIGVGQVIGTTLAGRWTDRFGPDRIRLISLSGVAGMLMVPQQHRLFSLAPDAPSVALGLKGSAIYAGGALGSAVGDVVLAWAGPKWLGPVAAVSVLLALALSTRREKQAPAHDRIHSGDKRPAEAR